MTYKEKKAKKLFWEEYLKECEAELKEEKKRKALMELHQVKDNE